MKNKIINLIAENVDIVSVLITIAYFYATLLIINEVIEQAFG